MNKLLVVGILVTAISISLFGKVFDVYQVAANDQVELKALGDKAAKAQKELDAAKTELCQKETLVATKKLGYMIDIQDCAFQYSSFTAAPMYLSGTTAGTMTVYGSGGYMEYEKIVEFSEDFQHFVTKSK